MAEINDDARGTYNENIQIRFKTSMLKSSLCDDSDAYILASRAITINGAGTDNNVKGLDKRKRGVIFKNYVPFTDCVSEINNTKDLGFVMLMYNLIEYSNNYSKTSGSLCQHYRDDPNDNIVNSESFKFKINITGKTLADGNTKDVKIAVPLKYLRNFWRHLEMSLTLFRMGLFGAAHRMGEAKRFPSLNSVTNILQ